MSSPGESYEEWQARTAPAKPVRQMDTRRWEWAVIVLLAVFFVWVGDAPGWIGLGLVVVLVAEQVVRPRLTRPEAPASPTPRLLVARGVTLVITLALSGWLVAASGGDGAAFVLPVLLVLLDVKDDRSFLRWVLEEGRRKLGR